MSMIFQGFGVPSEKDFKRYKAARIEHVVVGLMDEDRPNEDGIDLRPGKPDPSDLRDGFDVRAFWGDDWQEKLETALAYAFANDVKIWLMIWLRTTALFNQQACDALRPYLNHASIGGVVFNTERFWHKIVPPGMTHTQCVDQNVTPWIDEGWICLTSDYASCPGTLQRLLEVTHGYIWQGYPRSSWRRRDEKKHGHSVYTPDGIHKYAYRRVTRFVGHDKILIAGPGFYDLKQHPGGYKRAIRVQFDTIKALGVHGVCGWSDASKGRMNNARGSDVWNVIAAEHRRYVGAA